MIEIENVAVPRATAAQGIAEFALALKALQPGQSFVIHGCNAHQRAVITAVKALFDVRITAVSLAGGKVRVGRVE